MLKNGIVILLNLSICMGILITGCSSTDSADNLKMQGYPLTAFSVKIQDSYYHGKIDQYAHTITIGAIKNTYGISEIKYTLAEGATITPDPNSFLQEWQQEQEVTVTTKNKAATTYTIRFPKLEQEYREVLFYDGFDEGDIPDPAKWTLDTRKNLGDKKAVSIPPSEATYDQTFIENGNLVILAKKDGEEYYGGGVTTGSLFPFTFGFVEVKARLSKQSKGTLPAIWMWPKKTIYPVWPAGGEIDIMECLNHDKKIYQTIHTWYTYELEIKDNPKSSVAPQCKNPEDWHIYGVKWTPEKIEFYMDGEMTLSYPNLHLVDESEKMQWPFTKDSSFSLILSMGLGFPGAWQGPISDSELPARMEIDWVKISALNQTDL